MKGRVHSELSQGKQQIKKSGRYNLHDTVSKAPHLCWPNEGLQVPCWPKIYGCVRGCLCVCVCVCLGKLRRVHVDGGGRDLLNIKTPVVLQGKRFIYNGYHVIYSHELDN